MIFIVNFIFLQNIYLWQNDPSLKKNISFWKIFTQKKKTNT
jgi:hypothetical protein